MQGDAEVVLLARLDDRLQVVALLGDDADLLALRLGLDALEAERFLAANPAGATG